MDEITYKEKREIMDVTFWDNPDELTLYSAAITYKAGDTWATVAAFGRDSAESSCEKIWGRAEKKFEQLQRDINDKDFMLVLRKESIEYCFIPGE